MAKKQENKNLTTQLQKPVAIRTIRGYGTISADTALLLTRTPPGPVTAKEINISYKKTIM